MEESVKVATEPKFYRSFNDALLEHDADQINTLLEEILDTFGWSSEERAKIVARGHRPWGTPRSCNTGALISDKHPIDTV